MTVDVLLATYNGADYLKEQLDSIFAQSFQDFHLIVSDDCSTDQTAVILKSYRKKYPEKITLEFQRERKGARQNFSYLLTCSKAPYAMLADQDDVWKRDKVEKSLKKIQEKEGMKPCLIHSDLEVVDSQLKLISRSYWEFTHIHPFHSHALNRLLMQNVVTGCTAIVNRALIDKALPIPEDAVMHDWWLALVAAVYGKIEAIEEPLVLYRQHDNNVIGAKRFGSFKQLIGVWKRIKRQRLQKVKQAKHLLERDDLSKEDRDILQEYLKMDQSFWPIRFYKILNYGFYKQGVLRNLLSLFVKN